MSNVACRIFKEQIDLLLSLPSQEEAKTVLYYALINSLNQFENQIENQNENAYVSVSESESVSELSKSILNLLSKNIVWKEFSNNYGGKREGAGAPKNKKRGQVGQVGQVEQTETETETETESETNKLKTENIIKKLSDKFKLKENQFKIDYNFRIDSLPEIAIYRREVGDEILLNVQSWLIEKKFGQIVDKEFICRQIVKFSQRQGLI